jgi:ABC-2 type transport system ATP-binding protein
MAIARRYMGGEVTVDQAQRRISGPSSDGTGQVAGLVRELDSAAIHITGLELHRPSLDDVFLTLTGHQAEQEPEPAAQPARRWRRRAS